jgi:hypothetical protein
MDSLDQALVRAVIEARLATAAERRLAHDAARARRAARRAQNTLPTPPRPRRRRRPTGPVRPAWTTWPRRPTPTGAPTTALRVVAPPPALPPAVELARLLQDVAERVAEHGTRPERRVLAEVAAATRSLAPGAAAALVDRRGSEVARARAFGLLHGVVLGDLTARQQADLLDRLRGGGAWTQDRVA